MRNLPVLPAPKLSLTRYNSQVLLIWLERAVLVNCLARQAYRSEVDCNGPALLLYGKAREAAIFGKQVCDVLERRGYDSFTLDSVIENIEEDVFA
jgi:hypothetical protein